jgi:hypothetical protein
MMKKGIFALVLFFLSFVIFAEESFSERYLNNYIKDNNDGLVLYADMILTNTDTNEIEKFTYLLNISDGNGIIITMKSDGTIINGYPFSYDNIRKIFLLGDVHGGVWSINKAKGILDKIINLQFKILQVKDIKSEMGTKPNI